MGTILEIIFTAAIVIALLLFFGVPLASLITILAAVLLGLTGLTMVLMTVFFFATDIALLFKKRVRGRLLRVDDSGRYDHAVYQVGDVEYSCLFPAESFGRKRIYHVGEEYGLLISRNPERHMAYDRHSLFIIALGTVISVVFLGVLYFMVQYFSWLLS